MRRGVRATAGLAVLGLLAGCGMTEDLANQVKAMQAMPQTRAVQAQLNKVLAGIDDNARIVYVAIVNGQAQVCSVQPDGQRGVQLTSEAAYKCRPSWSPDHRRIAYFRYPEDRPVGKTVSVVVMDANGANAREVLAGKHVDATKTRVSWMPDGSAIYLQELDFPSMLFGYAVATGAQIDTIRLPKKTFLREAQTLSPNLQFIAGSGPDPKTQLAHIGVARRDGFGDTDLMSYFVKEPYHLGMVGWSYDSQKVAFELDTLVIVMSSAYLPGFVCYPINAQELSAAYTGPALSPSGKMLACILEKSKEGTTGSGDKEVRSDLWVMTIQGNNPRQITQSGSCFDPHW